MKKTKSFTKTFITIVMTIFMTFVMNTEAKAQDPISSVPMSTISGGTPTGSSVSVAWLPANPFVFSPFRTAALGTETLDSAYLLVWSIDSTNVESFDPTNLQGSWSCTGSNASRYCSQNNVFYRTIRAANITMAAPNFSTNTGVTAGTEYFLKTFAFLHNRSVFGATPPNLGESGGVYHFSQASNVLKQKSLAPPALTSVTPTGLIPMEAGNKIIYQFDQSVYVGNNPVTMIALDENDAETAVTINTTTNPIPYQTASNGTVEVIYNENLISGTKYVVKWGASAITNLGLTGVSADFERTFTADTPMPITIASVPMSTISRGTVTETAIAMTWLPANPFDFAPFCNVQLGTQGLDSAYLLVWTTDSTKLTNFDPANLQGSWSCTGSNLARYCSQDNVYYRTIRAANITAAAPNFTTNGGVTANTEYHLKTFAFIHNRSVFGNTPPNLNESGGIYHFSQASNVITQKTLAPPAAPALISVTPNQLLPMEANNKITYQFDMDVQYYAALNVAMIALNAADIETTDSIKLTIPNANDRTDYSIIEITYIEDLTPGTKYIVKWNNEVRNFSSTTLTANGVDLEKTFTVALPPPPAIESVPMSTIAVGTVTETSISVAWLPANPFDFAPFRDVALGTQGLDSAYLLVWTTDATKLTNFDPSNLQGTWTCTGSNLARVCSQDSVYYRTIRAPLITTAAPNFWTNGGVTANTEYHLKAFAFLHNQVVFSNTPPNLGQPGGIYHFSQSSNVITQKTLVPPAAPVLLSVTPDPTQRLPIVADNMISYKFDMDVFYGSGEIIATMIALDGDGVQTLDTIKISWPNTHLREDKSIIEITYNEDLTPGTQYKIAWNGQWIRNEAAQTQVMDDFFHIFTAESNNPLTENSILTFTVNGVNATIDEEALTIVAEIPGTKVFGTMRLTEVEVIFTISEGATATVEEIIVEEIHTMNFTDPVNYVVTSEAGESKTYVVTITEEEEVSIKDREIISFEIYPNPVYSELYIKAENLKQIEVIDMFGRIVIREQNNTERIDVSSLRKGVYFVRLTTTNNRMVIEKFVKK
ncbi:MAG: T9SS type A sorting domain-containing protein [Bacteroidales bacterium]|jgi:hypothetical protein|nr:T9SS type A sorting domain-containing protein [Bacteroidales bacterium]